MLFTVVGIIILAIL